MSLFGNEKIILPLPDATFEYYPNFLSAETANRLFAKLYKETPWQQDKITVFGKTHLQPRLTALYGNEGRLYGYSDILMKPHPWTTTLMFIKDEVEALTHQRFTSVLLNLYRNEKDSNGWHADDEKELGRDPFIASVSLGAERTFQIKHNTNKEIKQSLTLNHGSLLLMKEGSQIHYKHQLPKSSKPQKTRINLTFRTIF
ncbi:alpha-ketoglutarate-dependent dioxygenase AlkB [Flavobacterium sp. NRK F10]|uniref:Alpha-ketoglutarate-dependent dioxygenase AlkB n=1 Tax=Flavobacterium sediminis TaxID=2201181 RepID=A0A2U8QYK9_9FLAO|nr:MULTISPECIES: alpha-ketoglutarate-dependent dioxygenase AlkB [Flavobacterium]AWM15253.1 alpha-ketoglutarate-dependent dioxygenase AlkB [Flavobacterium sediminis]MCO6174125.1 alpha-ketoglutarate-dependent dioxygenase AlkB [Flavobacterium sp. NRK F10]